MFWWYASKFMLVFGRWETLILVSSFIQVINDFLPLAPVCWSLELLVVLKISRLKAQDRESNWVKLSKGLLGASQTCGPINTNPSLSCPYLSSFFSQTPQKVSSSFGPHFLDGSQPERISAEESALRMLQVQRKGPVTKAGWGKTSQKRCNNPDKYWSIIRSGWKGLSKINFLPWLVWLSGLCARLWTKGSLVRCPVRAHAWIAGQVPSKGRMRGNHTLMFLSLSFSLSFPL